MLRLLKIFVRVVVGLRTHIKGLLSPHLGDLTLVTTPLLVILFSIRVINENILLQQTGQRFFPFARLLLLMLINLISFPPFILIVSIGQCMLFLNVCWPLMCVIGLARRPLPAIIYGH